MDLVKAASLLRPGTAWNCIDENYEALVQAEDTTPRVDKPLLVELQAIITAHAYYENRAAQYPSFGDQLDALWKGGDAAASMLTQIQDIKTRFPKP